MPTYTNFNVSNANTELAIFLITCTILCFICVLISELIYRNKTKHIAKITNKYDKLLEIALARQNLIKRLK